ncbi:MAG TPA: nicotinate (nicotinamide) nucleotide adenylyltransferase [Solirubrobacteraceae bacterium]
MTDTSAPDRSAAPDSPAAQSSLRSLGILGGTFNPPTLGHLAIARHALVELALERVVLMPVGSPPHKQIAPDPGVDHRLAMCGLLVRGVEGLSVCGLELERDGPSYTVDTVRTLHARHPETELTFIVGADVASTLPSWHEPAALLDLATLAVAARPGSDHSEVVDAIDTLGGSDRVRFLDAPLIDVSSSRVRERAAAGKPIERLVGGDIADYVAEHSLYALGAQTVSR